jgi:hypothetical protein
LAGLTIVTNVRTYGPFGTLPNSPSFNGILFNATVPDDKTVVGFFAQADVNMVSKIGFYTI